MNKYRNIKIAIPEENREEIHRQVQGALFADGCKWRGGGKEVKYTSHPYLFVGANGNMVGNVSDFGFRVSARKATYYQEILAIDSNEMPKLEAGKHIIVSDSGEKYLYLSDDLCIRFAGDFWHLMEGCAWRCMANIAIKSVHSININEHASDCTVEKNNLIWTKEKTKEQKLREIIENAQKELDAL